MVCYIPVNLSLYSKFMAVVQNTLYLSLGDVSFKEDKHQLTAINYMKLNQI